MPKRQQAHVIGWHAEKKTKKKNAIFLVGDVSQESRVWSQQLLHRECLESSFRDHSYWVSKTTILTIQPKFQTPVNMLGMTIRIDSQTRKSSSQLVYLFKARNMVWESAILLRRQTKLQSPYMNVPRTAIRTQGPRSRTTIIISGGGSCRPRIGDFSLAIMGWCNEVPERIHSPLESRRTHGGRGSEYK